MFFNNKKLKEEQLLKLLSENLAHARHVENERLTFNSIFIAITAGFLAFVSNFNAISDKTIIITALFLLLAISLIGLLFTKRWSDVFDGHMDKAKQIALLIYGMEEPNQYEPKYNKYYYFSHDFQHQMIMHKLKKKQKKYSDVTYPMIAAGMNFNFPWRILYKVRTRFLFYIFYFFVICAIIILIIFCLTGKFGCL